VRIEVASEGGLSADIEQDIEAVRVVGAGSGFAVVADDLIADL